MRICPVELELCERSACSRSHCALSEEHALVACADCGVLVTYRRFAVCIDCESAEEAVER